MRSESMDGSARRPCFLMDASTVSPSRCMTATRPERQRGWAAWRPLPAGSNIRLRRSRPREGRRLLHDLSLAASPGGDQPGARIEDHAALVAVVRREHLAQARHGPGRLPVAQPREGRARVLKPPDERERGVEIVSVEDRLVDVLETHAVEAGVLEDARGGFGIAEREGVRARLWWLRRVAQRRVDRPRPFVVLVSLPDDHRQARLGSKGSAYVGERGGRIGEKHRPEAADRHVEAGGLEAMHLGVAELVPDVAEPFDRRPLTGALKHALGHVDADNAARRRGARRLASRQPGSAPDVDYLIAAADAVGGAKVPVVGA